MAGVGFRITVQGAERFLKMLEQSEARVHQGIVKALKEGVAIVRADAVLNAPHVSGRLRRSIRGRVEESRLLGASFGIIGSDVIYARIQELGGEIKPVHAQYLAVPLEAAKTPTGRVRGGPRTFANTFIIRSRSGSLLIMQRHGGGIRPLFALTKSITVRGKHYMERALQSNRPRLRALFGREVKASLQAP